MRSPEENEKKKMLNITRGSAKNRTGTTLIILFRLFNTRCIMNFDFPQQPTEEKNCCIVYERDVCGMRVRPNWELHENCGVNICLLKLAYKNIFQQIYIQCIEPFEITVRSPLSSLPVMLLLFVDFASRNIIHFAIENDKA